MIVSLIRSPHLIDDANARMSLLGAADRRADQAGVLEPLNAIPSVKVTNALLGLAPAVPIRVGTYGYRCRYRGSERQHRSRC